MQKRKSRKAKAMAKTPPTTLPTMAPTGGWPPFEADTAPEGLLVATSVWPAVAVRWPGEVAVELLDKEAAVGLPDGAAVGLLDDEARAGDDTFVMIR
jgi:hypothetical protein